MSKILVVEDDPLYADSIALTLSREGYETRVARTSHQGIREGIACNPQLLIVDWILNDDHDGGEVAERIQAAHPGLRTIVITGYPDIADKVRRSHRFIDEVIEKPFHAEEILAAVGRVLAQGGDR